jgi:RNA polymerase-binding transcription factor DksA
MFASVGNLFTQDASRSTPALIQPRAVLEQVREALQRIRAGTYRRCLADGQPIETERLDAAPRVRSTL